MSMFLKPGLDTWEFIVILCVFVLKYFIINETNMEGNSRTPGTADK